MVIGGGLALLAVFLLVGYWFGASWFGEGPAGLAVAAKIFIPVWLIAALVNMWLGVSRAGYTVVEELPMLLIVFGGPAAVAGFVLWYVSR
jgi:hypothetical protein